MRPSPTSIAGTRTDTRPVSIQSRVNAGLTIGPVIFGAVGDDTRLEFTVIGEPVPLRLVLAGAAGSAAADFGDQDPRVAKPPALPLLVAKTCKAFLKLGPPWWNGWRWVVRGWLCGVQGNSVQDRDLQSFVDALVVKVP
jgi:hypothetical protein